jgi:hypothetical protein
MDIDTLDALYRPRQGQHSQYLQDLHKKDDGEFLLCEQAVI